MAITFLEKRKRLRYLVPILAIVVLITIFVVWYGFFVEREEPLLELALKPPIRQEIEIDFEAIRRPLKVVLPHFSAELFAEPSSVSPGERIDLIANIHGIIGDTLLVYKFDCNNDGEYELETEAINESTYLADGLCYYVEQGEYTARVFIGGEFNYFIDGAERTTKKSVEGFAKIIVKEPNLDPIISFCDVSPKDGSTLSGFEFNFNVKAIDPDGDELSYLWDFGDGTIKKEPNPSHQYIRPGVYFPFVRVFDLANGAKRGGSAICYPASLIPFGKRQVFEEIGRFDDKPEPGRENPFVPY